ncbi:MAG: CaiB/BaiF CoA transferase family protein [Beijerinckiaceae bacterium]
MSEDTSNVNEATRKAPPLSGLQVLDFGHTIMGPCAGLVFADLGADVIKIEPVGGDPTRRLPGFAAGFYATFNRNKRSLAVDLKTRQGQSIVRRLAARADVVVENFAPGTIERLECGWENLRAVNPRLIYLSLKGYLKGLYENRPALDEVVQMQTGLAYMTGPPGRPLRAGASVVDIVGGVFGVVGVLAALRERDLTGQGQKIGSALFESSAFLVGTHIAGSAVTGQIMPPMPARKNPWAIYDIFLSNQAEQIFLGITGDAQWKRFCDAFAMAEWSKDPRLIANVQRRDERDWLIPAIGDLFASLDTASILDRCTAAGVPHARVGRPDELQGDPHLNQHGGLLGTALAGFGGGAMAGLPALPLEFGDARQRPGLSRQPPRIGEHTREILNQLDYSDAEIAEILDSGIAVQA